MDDKANATNPPDTPVSNRLVSVVVPIFNAEPYLDQCLESIRRQFRTNLQIICLNDGSTDRSLAIMKRHAAEDNRILIVDKSNEGYGATCNKGIKLAEGEWVSIIEPDDWIDQGMYERMLTFESGFDADCDIVKTPYWRILDPDTPNQRKINCSYRSRIKPKHQPFTVEEAPHLLRHHPSIWSALYRRTFLSDNGIAFHEIPGAGWADNPFLIDTLCKAKSIVYLDEPFYCYREDPPEKAEAALRKDPELPMRRWKDMHRSISEMGLRSGTVLEELYRRAFTYLDEIEEAGVDEEVLSLMKKDAFLAMDPTVVLSSKVISPDRKRRFAEALDLPAPEYDSIRWTLAMLGEFAYTLRNTGLSHTLSMVRKQLR